MQIVIGKCISGEFVVGKLESRIDPRDKTERAKMLLLTDVYSIIIHPDPANQQRLRSMIMPMMAPFDDKSVKEISVERFILKVIEAPEDIERVYIKLTTGIDVVSAGTKIIQ